MEGGERGTSLLKPTCRVGYLLQSLSLGAQLGGSEAGGGGGGGRHKGTWQEEK